MRALEYCKCVGFRAFETMSDSFVSELSTRLTAVMATSAPVMSLYAPGVDDCEIVSNMAIGAPTRHEVIEAIGLGSYPGCSLETSVSNIQRQNNIILRLLLNTFAFSPSPRLSSGSNSRASPLLLARSVLTTMSDRGPSPPACFTCPICLEVLCEKSFTKHIKEWPKKAAKILEGRRVRKEKCQGICSVDHPLLRLTAGVGDLVARVEALVSIVVALTTPGSYRAHSPEGTGNELKVQAYFDMLWARPS